MAQNISRLNNASNLIKQGAPKVEEGSDYQLVTPWLRDDGGGLGGFWATLEGCWLQHTRGLFGPSVNRWSINEVQMARNMTGGLPVVNQGRMTSLGPIRERLTPAHEKR